VCGWEDDPTQVDNPDLGGGANTPSLNDAKKNFIEIGAVARKERSFVRPPKENELP
jgi:hypothetical protein